MADKLYAMLDYAQIDFGLKQQLYKLCTTDANPMAKVVQLQSLDIPKDLVDAILEILCP